MWDLVPWLRIKPRPSALGAQNLSPLDHKVPSLSQTQTLVTQLPLRPTYSLGTPETINETPLNRLLSPLAWKSSWSMPTWQSLPPLASGALIFQKRKWSTAFSAFRVSPHTVWDLYCFSSLHPGQAQGMRDAGPQKILHSISTLSLVFWNSLLKCFPQLQRVFGYQPSNLVKWERRLCQASFFSALWLIPSPRIFAFFRSSHIYRNKKSNVSIPGWNQGVGRATVTAVPEGIHPLLLPCSEITFLASDSFLHIQS